MLLALFVVGSAATFSSFPVKTTVVQEGHTWYIHTSVPLHGMHFQRTTGMMTCERAIVPQCTHERTNKIQHIYCTADLLKGPHHAGYLLGADRLPNDAITEGERERHGHGQRRITKREGEFLHLRGQVRHPQIHTRTHFNRDFQYSTTKCRWFHVIIPTSS